MISTIFIAASWIALFVFGGLVLNKVVREFVAFVAKTIREENDRDRR